MTAAAGPAEPMVEIQEPPEEGQRFANDAAQVITRAAQSVQETTGVVQALGDKTAQIGEFSWNIENLLNKVLNKTVEPGPALLEHLGDVVR